MGWLSRSFLYSVPLPTPEGPEIIIGRLSERVMAARMKIVSVFALKE